MIAIPAIDLREGNCVQLVGGSYTQERVRVRDPIAVAKRWRDVGFAHVHVVDLDAATGRGSNDATVRALLAERGAAVQVGGGVRTEERLLELLDLGASRVVVGTRALREPQWLEKMARIAPASLVVAVDVRNGVPVTHGWASPLAADLGQLLRDVNALPLAAILVTAVDVEGRLSGPDLPLIQDVMRRVTLPVIAAGGVTTIADLRALRDRGVWAAVVGMALYTGTLDAAEAAWEFGR